MKIFFALITILAFVGCASAPTHFSGVRLVTDHKWPLGEARTCLFDGQYKEMHCFPAANLFAPKIDYLVDADFSTPPQFDKGQWSYDITCRLDSFNHASCTGGSNAVRP